ncbi:MAG: exodeoxyribonuclease VII large subunit, partial [Caulobacteraceae bacterium]|nr:exodeoxyribonuclease VII large subunit [Caulobacter sp.]
MARRACVSSRAAGPRRERLHTRAKRPILRLVTPADDASAASATNAAAYSVSELAFALKRTLEDAYGHVRLRGEVSKVTRHASGHVYLSLKDDKA